MSERSDTARTRAGARSADGDKPRRIIIDIDGMKHEWHLPLTLARVADVRAALGMSGRRFLSQFQDADLDSWVTATWLARREAGENITLAEVMEEHADATDVTITFPDDDDEDGDEHPEA